MEITSMSRADAQRVIWMASAASKSAAEHHKLYGGDRSSIVDLAVGFITRAVGRSSTTNV